jgi:hypothetical protein
VEEPVSNVLEAVPAEDRALILEELTRRNPTLLDELWSTQKPTNDQSDAVVDVLYRAMSENYGPGHIPNAYGKAIDDAIGAYLLAWPIYR